MHQIVEIDPEECQQAESIPKEQHLREPAGPPAQVMPLAEAETVMEGFGGLGGSAQVDQFGPQARAAFRPPRGREAETAEAPTLQGQPFAMAPVVPAAFQGCDGSLLGPAARHQFKKTSSARHTCTSSFEFQPHWRRCHDSKCSCTQIVSEHCRFLGFQYCCILHHEKV